MRDIIQHSFKLNLRILTAVGLYCPHKVTTYFKVRAYVTYTLCTLLVTLLGILYLALGEDFTPAEINNDAYLVAQMACQVTKLLPFVINANSVKNCIHYFEKSQFTLYGDNHIRILESCSQICKRNSTVFIYLVASGNVFWAIKPFFSEEQILPVDIWLPFNSSSRPNIMYCIYIYLVVAVGYTSVSCATIDTIIAGLACLATGQLKILKDHLQHLNDYDINKYENAHKYTPSKQQIQKVETLQSVIQHCIRYHNSILTFISEYQDCFSLTIFGQFMGSIIVIGFSCLQISKSEPLTYDFVSMVTFLCIFLVQVYFYCYYGTTLSEESNTLTDAIYMGKWYDYDLQAKKKLIILMERSKRPIIITAGRILNMSVETFTAILKRSYSLLAVLQNQ